MGAEIVERRGRVKDPASRVSSLILAYTGIYIDPVQIKKVIKSDFENLAAYAHQIHDEEKS